MLRTGQCPLARCLYSLLTGYTGAFDRRYRRVGHLFQNRYKSIVVEEELYLLELVRYIHLNPLRAAVVPDMRTLDGYAWTGHSALLGNRACTWQATAAVLQQFGPTPARARRAYHAFVVAGMSQGRRPDLQGGGLVRSLGGWAAVTSLRRGREAYGGDERILGSPAFVDRCRREAAIEADPPPGTRPGLPDLLTRVCRVTGSPFHSAPRPL